MVHQTPSLRLAEDLKNSKKKFQISGSTQLPYHVLSDPPPQCNVNFEHFRYIKYQPVIGKDSYGTVQEFARSADADRHSKTQTMYDSRVLIHPYDCVRHEDKHILIFDKIITDFKIWIEALANGGVSEEVMWEILKQIVKNLIYLASESRPHGNLRGGGIAITIDCRPLFLNLGADNKPHIFRGDVEALKDILEDVETKLPEESKIRKHVSRWKSFLSAACLDVKPEHVLRTSRIFPPYCPVHLKLIYNYPIARDVTNKADFLANMYNLCRDNLNDHDDCNLLNNAQFVTSLRAAYSDWPAMLTDGSVIALHEVYKFGLNNSQYKRVEPATNTEVASEESIVIFAYDCIRHHKERSQHYNEDPTATVQLPDLTYAEIMGELYTKFPYLIEDIYEAFQKALAGGYAHCRFPVAKILTGII